MDPLGLIIFVIVVGLIAWILTLIVDAIPMLAPFNQIARAIILVVALLMVLRALWPMLGGYIH